jgi:hypothetical protein
MKSKLLLIIISVLFLLTPVLNYGQIAPDLKSAGNFGILAGTAITSAGVASVINDMDVGLSPGFRSSITGFPPSSVVNGAIYAADDIAPPGVPAMLLQAKLDLSNAYLFAANSTAPAPATIAGDQGGTTLYPGIYKSTSTLLIQSGNLTLDAQGDANAVWIFQIAADFTTIGGSPNPSPSGGNVILTNGALADNVFWQVGTSATIGDYTDFKGNISALTSITMNTGSSIAGRLLARNGAVTLAGMSTIIRPEVPPDVPGDLTLVITANPHIFDAAGDVINYHIVVTNTSEGILSDINVSDDLTASSWIVTLNPGQSDTHSTSYTIIQADVDRGFVVNIATAEAGNILINAYEIVTTEEALPPVIPLATWSLILAGVLIAVFVVIRYHRMA